MRLKSKVRAGIAALALGVLGTAVAAVPAHAGSEMTGYFPWIKGCTSDQQQIYSTGVWDKYGRYVGQARVYWSARCVTNWVQVAPSNPNGMGIYASISNQYGRYGQSAKDNTVGTGAMLYSPASAPCLTMEILVSAGPWSDTYNDPAPKFTVC
ncbi:hypothetical protein ACFV9C_33415 [Kribbella sp. NPDC059898]|uniref:hypothetical protein n=1 Tax=Kribbella sp. NPDC059898 TaxID=3346995 RepID=UPI00366176BD